MVVLLSLWISDISVGRGTIDPSFITVGATTKEQVVLRCGYPSATVSDDEKVFTYSWDTS